MGVEYRHHVLPQDRLLRPDVAALQSLVKRLTAAKFLPKGSFYVVSASDAHGEQEQSKIHASFAMGTVSAIWNCDEENPARYPFASASPYPEDEDYWTIELHLAGELLCYSGELVGPTNLECSECGESLEREDEHPALGGWITEVARTCPSCQHAVTPAEHRCELNLEGVPNPTRVETIVGGGLFRCALFIDCGKSMPELPTQLHPELRAILHETLGPAIEVPDVH